ncbi:hypothetical protein [Dyella sp. 2RAB6]|uniref:hypothetical protein n=1 Tax=Dyella sp. 2RAB6 TaxID=3232992 RepID=UPI003F8E6134
MNGVVRREMIGKWELSLTEIKHPANARPTAYRFGARMSLGGGRFTKEIGERTRRFLSMAAAWTAGREFIGEE